MVANDTKDTLEKQLTDLREEFDSWKERARGRAEDFGDDVSDWADDAVEQARGTGRALRARTLDATDVVSENPTIFSSAAALAAVAGIAAGILIGQAMERHRRWF